MSCDPYTGDVYWCSSFPGLHGHAAKERFAVVISPPDKTPDANGKYLVVPTSCSSLSTYTVKLPNKSEQPQTSSGLPNPCVAVCDEFKLVDSSVLTTHVGDLRTPTVAKLQAMVIKVVEKRVAEQKASSEAESKLGAPPTITPADPQSLMIQVKLDQQPR